MVSIRVHQKFSGFSVWGVETWRGISNATRLARGGRGAKLGGVMARVLSFLMALALSAAVAPARGADVAPVKTPDSAAAVAPVPRAGGKASVVVIPVREEIAAYLRWSPATAHARIDEILPHRWQPPLRVTVS